MARRKGGGAFFFGSVIGGAVGSLVALWKTPQSGRELRQKLGLEGDVAGSVTSAAKQAATKASSTVSTTTQAGSSLGSKALGFVEQAAAPIVGVKLGQTANNSQPGEASLSSSRTIPAESTTTVTPTTSTATSTTPTAGEVSPGLVPPAGTVPVMPSGSK